MAQEKFVLYVQNYERSACCFCTRPRIPGWNIPVDYIKPSPIRGLETAISRCTEHLCHFFFYIFFFYLSPSFSLEHRTGVISVPDVFIRYNIIISERIRPSSKRAHLLLLWLLLPYICNSLSRPLFFRTCTQPLCFYRGCVFFFFFPRDLINCRYKRAYPCGRTVTYRAAFGERVGVEFVHATVLTSKLCESNAKVKSSRDETHGEYYFVSGFIFLVPQSAVPGSNNPVRAVFARYSSPLLITTSLDFTLLFVIETI